MCKFCNNKEEKQLLFYDNHDSMNVYCGQYQGVNVISELSLRGNMLILSASGSYRSRSDCYYEDEGLDCDNEPANGSKSKTLKIKYCPFCGKEIKSNVFENHNTELKIEKANKKIEDLKKQIEYCNTPIYFVINVPNNKRKEFLDYFFEGDWTNKMTLKEIFDKYGNIKCFMQYGRVKKENIEDFTISTKIRFRQYYCGEAPTCLFNASDDTIKELAEMGIPCTIDEKKRQEVFSRKAKFISEIAKLEENIKTLEKTLK